MQLSVVILNYNVCYFLEQCVVSVQRSICGIDAEIIVVDNNSQDESCAMMKSRFPNVKLIQNTENTGFPKGNNIGVAAAKGNYICILNPDTVVAEDTFEKVLAFAECQANLGIIGVKLIDGSGNFLRESKRGVPTPWVAFTKIIGLYKLSNWFGKYYASHLNENETGKVDILVGAFMVMKRDLYNEIGGFDENCFMYSDDIDLSYMVLKKGKSNFYLAETTAIHYKGESTVKDETYMKRFREAMDFFYRKHFRVSVLFDVFMKSGAYFFSVFKQRQTASAKAIKRYQLVSDNEALRQALFSVTSKAVIFEAGTAFEQSVLESGTEMVFDAGYLTFRQIILQMQRDAHSSMTFKIAYADRGFVIGSNSSNGRGEVIRLTDQPMSFADSLKTI